MEDAPKYPYQLNFFMKTAVTPERKVEKLIPRWEINRHAKGYNWVIDQNWCLMHP